MNNSAQFDVIVVGSGVAGLCVALNAHPDLNIAVITQGTLGRDGSSNLAQGGIAAALADDDGANLHRRDTFLAGSEQGRKSSIAAVCNRAADEIAWLAGLGMCFDKQPGGALALGKEAAHSKHRIVHAGGDRTGQALMTTLLTAARDRDNITFVEQTIAVDASRRGNRFFVLTNNDKDQAFYWQCSQLVLATGGCGALYAQTTNQAEAQGTHLAIAHRLGARLTDLEFVQFHPTALAIGGHSLPLLTEALRGAGARICDAKGSHLLDHHPLGSLAPRDAVALAIAQAQYRGSQAFLDLRTLAPTLPEKFPGAVETLRAAHLDPAHDLIPITPAAHYHMGGVATDIAGRTSIPNLYACGEAACSGMHGANRLASNSLLEGLVMGRLCGQALRRRPASDSVDELNQAVSSENSLLPSELVHQRQCSSALLIQLQALMQRHFGVVRSSQKMAEGLEELANLRKQAGSDSSIPNALLAAQLIASSAYLRKQSVGAHQLEDAIAPIPRGISSAA